jgi:hypothetical protein
VRAFGGRFEPYDSPLFIALARKLREASRRASGSSWGAEIDHFRRVQYYHPCLLDDLAITHADLFFGLIRGDRECLYNRRSVRAIDLPKSAAAANSIISSRSNSLGCDEARLSQYAVFCGTDELHQTCRSVPPDPQQEKPRLEILGKLLAHGGLVPEALKRIFYGRVRDRICLIKNGDRYGLVIEVLRTNCTAA